MSAFIVVGGPNKRECTEIQNASPAIVFTASALKPQLIAIDLCDKSGSAVDPKVELLLNDGASSVCQIDTPNVPANRRAVIDVAPFPMEEGDQIQVTNSAASELDVIVRYYEQPGRLERQQ